jgi:hypothetical protein
MSTVLDLSGADNSGFEAVDAGAYNATVFEISQVETSGSGKLPAGTPMVKVQFAAQDEEIANRRFFTNYVIPNETQQPDAQKRARGLGMFVNFLVALGEDEKKLKTKGFDLEGLQDLVGRECVIKVGKELYKRSPEDDGEWTNPVKAVKPAGSPIGGSSGSSSDLL